MPSALGKIYTEKAPNAVSRYRPYLQKSLLLIEQVASDRSASIIDVGGGESTLVDHLLDHGYEDITVLDISRTAIDANRKRLVMLLNVSSGLLQTSQNANYPTLDMTPGTTVL